MDLACTAGAPKGVAELLVEGCIASERSLEGNDAWFGGGGGGGECGDCEDEGEGGRRASSSSPPPPSSGLSLATLPCPSQCAWPPSIHAQDERAMCSFSGPGDERRERDRFGENAAQKIESDDGKRLARGRRTKKKWRKKRVIFCIVFFCFLFVTLARPPPRKKHRTTPLSLSLCFFLSLSLFSLSPRYELYPLSAIFIQVVFAVLPLSLSLSLSLNSYATPSALATAAGTGGTY